MAGLFLYFVQPPRWVGCSAHSSSAGTGPVRGGCPVFVKTENRRVLPERSVT